MGKKTWTLEQRAKAAERARKRWANPNDSLRKVHKSPEYRAKRSEISLQLWSNPEFKERMRLALTEAQNRPEIKAKLSAAHRKKWAR